MKTKEVTYVYDVFGRRIAKDVDDDGNGTIDRGEVYVYDSAGKRDPATGVLLDDVVLVYDRSDALVARYLHGPAIDEVLAEENSSGDVLWALADHLGTLRDWATYDAGSDITTVDNHVTFTVFGTIASQTNGSHTVRFAFTGREWDADSELFYYRARWYDPLAGRFISEDPLGFIAKDSNLARYVGTSPVTATDPSGKQLTTGGSGHTTVNYTAGLSPLYYFTQMTPTARPAQHDKSYWRTVMASPTQGGPWATVKHTVPARPENVPHSDLSLWWSGSAPINTRPNATAQYPPPPVNRLPNGYPNNLITGVSGYSGMMYTDIPPLHVVGATGAGPCIICIIVSPPSSTGVDVWAYHFSAQNNPYATLSNSGPFPDGSTVYLAGGHDVLDTDDLEEIQQSAGTLASTLRYIQQNAHLTIGGYSNTNGLFVDRTGDLHIRKVELQGRQTWTLPPLPTSP